MNAIVQNYLTKQLGHVPCQKTQYGRRIPIVKRTRRPVSDIYRELGKTYFKRAYRMGYGTFKKLFRTLAPKLKILRADKHSKIHSTVVLACALGLFAGGSAYDLATTYGISVRKAYQSLGLVIDAINQTDELTIKFPSDHQEQLKIAQDFQQKSTPGFAVCVGALDDMLVWMEKPTDKECEMSKVNSKKFHCARKSKFGMNLQALCDSKRRFLFCGIGFPGSSSNHLAWESCAFKRMVEKEGFLAAGLCIFVDNAYINSTYLATPFTNASGTRDDYNFFSFSA